MTRGAGLTGVVYEDDADMRRAIAVIVERGGFSVVADDEAGPGLLPTVQIVRPDLVVLELAQAGVQGLAIVTALLAAAPHCSVVLLSPFESLREPALELGAYALLDREDLQGLEECVLTLARRPHAGAEPSPLPGDMTYDAVVARQGEDE